MVVLGVRILLLRYAHFCPLVSRETLSTNLALWCSALWAVLRSDWLMQ
jgi:hypothetical protein